MLKHRDKEHKTGNYHRVSVKVKKSLCKTSKILLELLKKKEKYIFIYFKMFTQKYSYTT